jgi:prefoldin subunit 5
MIVRNLIKGGDSVFVTKKEFDELENKVKVLENIIHNMQYHMIQLQQEINELKNPEKKEPVYFG